MPKRAHLVALVTATLLGVAANASPAQADTTGPVAQSGPANALAKLVQLTKRAVIGGRKVLTSKAAKRARKIGSRARKVTNFYCDQWVAHFQRFPYPRLSIARAVGVWRLANRLHPEFPAGRAYWYCWRLAYWPIVRYG